jgi:hypothetical protein
MLMVEEATSSIATAINGNVPAHATNSKSDVEGRALDVFLVDGNQKMIPKN